jgi:hypothetical protein
MGIFLMKVFMGPSICPLALNCGGAGALKFDLGCDDPEGDMANTLTANKVAELRESAC